MQIAKSDFIGLEGVIHLVAGGETPMLKRHAEAFAQFAADKACGIAGRERFEATRERVRVRLADMLGMQPGDLALLGNSSEAIAQVISSINWKPGDSVVAGEHEFPSGPYALARLRALGVELRLVPTRNQYLEIDDLIAACDASTKLVYASHVSYLTGQRLDVPRLAAGVHQQGAALLLDATHALGVVPVPGEACDFVVCSGYKWLLASHIGILAWNRRRQPEFTPIGVGWRSGTQSDNPEDVYSLHTDATRAELGNPNHLDVYILESALEYLHGVGSEQITTHVLDLGGELRAALVALDLPVTTPEAAAERAGNICFLHPHAEQFSELGPKYGMQLWGGDGRVRLSVHLYVSHEDVLRLIALLPEILQDAL
jgi:cysteine desulfurase / selenocysteine lyase